MFSFLRQFGKLGFLLSPCAFGSLESSTSVFDAALTGLILLPKSSARSEVLLSVPDHASSGSSLLSRDLGCSDSTLFAFGLTWSGPVFALLLTDSCQIDLTPLLHSSARLELSAFVLLTSSLGLLMSLRSLARSGFAPSVLNFVKVGSFMSARSPGCLGSPTLFLGMICIDFVISLSILDFLHLDFSLFSRSLGRLGFVVLPLETSCLDLLLSTRSLAHSGFQFFILDAKAMGLSLSLHSFAHLGLTMSIFGVACSDFVFLVICGRRQLSWTLFALAWIDQM